jgi:hypothetical protein
MQRPALLQTLAGPGTLNGRCLFAGNPWPRMSPLGRTFAVNKADKSAVLASEAYR